MHTETSEQRESSDYIWVIVPDDSNNVTVIDDYKSKLLSKLKFIPQHCVLHKVVSVEKPVQSAPPHASEGLLQVLDLVCIPPPQVALHDP